ncbi:Na(+)/H(+) antiporter [Magnaporthiopsis poae ATCC 64411]|uniref:Na(+)/H(+) antiporter n=1 Tax=Magnaporthiopsis poae (strain ATCC 64411 / 73-15) TaxID=644358 RepID=A0A0C4DYB9_MAGP6|nr:Na(+)/H(+) antiporter [Magnaporthiopsis poae ATCC 64411]
MGPTLDPSELNIIIAIVGAFIIIYGLFSVLIKGRWFLGEALPAMAIGVVLGPVAGRLLDNTRWGPGNLSEDQKDAITLGFMRVMISVQLVIAGYQLPAKYAAKNWREIAVLLLPTMTLMWLCTTACMMATIPKITLLAGLVIGSCVTSTDPVLSQAIAKGPFADKYVPRALREIISAEAGANDGFSFPFLMLAINLMRHTELPGVVLKPSKEKVKEAAVEVAHRLLKRAGDIGRLDGGFGGAMRDWVVDTWLYIIFMSVFYGALIGLGGSYAIKFCLRRKWIDHESYLLFPVALALFITGTAGALGTNDLLACFCAGNALNWDGEYLAETLERHDEVNSSLDVLLNFTGFMYVGVIMPWSSFHDPDGTGITIGRLIGLGFLVLLFRRIPAIMLLYKAMPRLVKSWKEGLFMGYFGPIGVGAVFYVEHTKHLFPHIGETGDVRSDDMLRALVPSVYFLVMFSIVVHGLSIPVLDMAYRYLGVEPVTDDAVQMRRKSAHVAPPANARVDSSDSEYFVAYNRFSRPVPNNRRTVIIDGRKIQGLPQYNNANNGGAAQGSDVAWADEVDPVEEEKIRANMRAASLQRLG